MPKRIRTEYMRAWREKNRQHLQEYRDSWRSEQKERLHSYEQERWISKKTERSSSFKQWRDANLEREREKKRLYARSHRERVKMEVISHYSQGTLKCAFCGFSDMRALTIDHIHNDGGAQRKLLYKSGHATYHYLIVNGFPSGFQVLCRNCNWIKEFENGKTKLL